MGTFFTAGERKIRPGIYQRYQNRGISIAAGTTDGFVAIPIQANWGPLGVVTACESANAVKETFGSESTVDAAIAAFTGGATRVYAYRLGTSGTKATCPTSGEVTPSANGTITAKYEGTRAIKVAIRETVENTTKEIVIYDGDTKVESFSFAVATDEISNLIAAVADSKYITVTSLGESDKTVSVMSATALTGGTNPTVTNASYSSAFTALEAYKFNVIALDTVTSAVQTLLHEWISRVYETGKLVMAVMGGANSTDSFGTQKSSATAFDDEKIIRSGIYGYDAENNLVDGYQAAAIVAGVVASTGADTSIVHKTVPGIATITPYTNAQYEEAISAGLLLSSYSPSESVWFDSGINTLITPDSNQDDGWKKIRRVKTRFELMTRIDETVSPLIGRINCDNDGIAIFIQTAQGVLNDMVAEGKIISGATIYEDTNNPHESDSAWFIIEADDIDSLEKAYLNYQFRFSTNS